MASLKNKSFTVFGITFTDKKDFTSRIGYKAQLSHSLIIKRHGSWENYLRNVVFKGLSDNEIISRLKVISSIQENKDEIDSLIWRYFELLNNSIKPELKEILMENIVNSSSGVSKEILETAIRTELEIKNRM